MIKTSVAGLIALTFLATTGEGQAFDSDEFRGWGSRYNSHLDSYSGRPLGPPLTALPPGYDYYNGRLIRLPYYYGPAGIVYVRPHTVKKNRTAGARSGARRR
jgi:hypothetical protein